MKLKVQLVLGVLNSTATALSIVVMAPVYLLYLGAEAYGLIGFYTTLLLCMQLFDMGMATTLNREVARYGKGHLSEENTRLLQSIEQIYLAISAAFVLGVWLAGEWLAQHWFTANSLSIIEVSLALYGMGICIALRLPINVYQAALFGAQKMHIVSMLGVSQVIIGAIGTYLLLRFCRADIVTFFVWQSCIALIHFFVIRTFVWRKTTKLTEKTKDLRLLMQLCRYSLGVGLVSIAGLILSQIDKVVLSKTLDLKHYGYYMLASSLAACLYIVSTPLYNLFFPAVSKLLISNEPDALLSKYQFYSALLASLVFPITLFFILFLPPLADLWLHDSEAIDTIVPVASLLIIATALHAIMHLPHALMMAYGISKGYLIMYLALILLSLPITALMSLHYGAIGGAWGQIILFSAFAVAGTFITHHYCLKGHALKWLFQDIGRPFAVVACFAFLIFAFDLNTHSFFTGYSIVFSSCALLALCVLCAWVNPSTRQFLLANVRRR